MAPTDLPNGKYHIKNVKHQMDVSLPQSTPPIRPVQSLFPGVKPKEWIFEGGKNGRYSISSDGYVAGADNAHVFVFKGKPGPARAVEWTVTRHESGENVFTIIDEEGSRLGWTLDDPDDTTQVSLHPLTAHQTSSKVPHINPEQLWILEPTE